MLRVYFGSLGRPTEMLLVPAGTTFAALRKKKNLKHCEDIRISSKPGTLEYPTNDRILADGDVVIVVPRIFDCLCHRCAIGILKSAGYSRIRIPDPDEPSPQQPGLRRFSAVHGTQIHNGVISTTTGQTKIHVLSEEPYEIVSDSGGSNSRKGKGPAVTRRDKQTP